MNKGTFLIALMLLWTGTQAHADESVAKEQSEPQDEVRNDELRKALSLLLQAGLLKPNENGEITVDQRLIERLRQSGLIETGQSNAASICIDPGL